MTAKLKRVLASVGSSRSDSWNQRSATVYSLRYMCKLAMFPAISLPFFGLDTRHHVNSSMACEAWPAFNHANASRLWYSYLTKCYNNIVKEGCFRVLIRLALQSSQVLLHHTARIDAALRNITPDSSTKIIAPYLVHGVRQITMRLAVLGPMQQRAPELAGSIAPFVRFPVNSAEISDEADGVGHALDVACEKSHVVAPVMRAAHADDGENNDYGGGGKGYSCVG